MHLDEKRKESLHYPKEYGDFFSLIRVSLSHSNADITQLVECQPSKLKVASSNLVIRSNIGE